MAEKSATSTEPENPHYKYALKVLKANKVVGHILRDLLKYHTSALLSGGTKKCVIIGKRENKLGNML